MYDAKTHTGGILIYVLVYGVFTLLIRSLLGVFMMNLLSAITLPRIFSVPFIYQTPGSYFDFQLDLGIIATIFIALIQAVLFVPIRIRAQIFRSSKVQYALSTVVAIAFTIGLTIFVSHVTPLPRPLPPV